MPKVSGGAWMLRVVAQAVGETAAEIGIAASATEDSSVKPSSEPSPEDPP